MRCKEYIHNLMFLAVICAVISCGSLACAADEAGVEDSEPLTVMVPDTGQRDCFDDHKKIPCPDPGEPFFGQDGNYSINSPQYELINQDGVEMVIDHVTGLSWQRLPDKELRTWSEAIDYADNLEMLGFADWRLPKKEELQSILLFGDTPSPLITPTEGSSMDEITEGACAWTLTTRIFPSLHAKALCLDEKQGKIADKYEKKYVYAVRGPPQTYGNYKDNGDGTVLDQASGLLWQANEIRAENWKDALAYCDQLELGGYSDWRLPTIKELSSLVDEDRINPSINTTFFPATRSAPYWTGTTFTGHPAFAWYVRFDNGLEYNGGYKGRRYFVRAVRGGLVAAGHPPLPSFLHPPEEQQDQLEKPEPPKADSMDMLEPYPLELDTP